MANASLTTTKPDGGGPPQQQDQYGAHPAVHKHLAAFSDAMHELEALRAQKLRMENHIRVLETSLQEIQYQCDNERTQKEKFQRYSSKVQTLIESMAVLAKQADDAAVAYAMKQDAKPIAPSKTPKMRNELERAIDEITDELNEKP